MSKLLILPFLCWGLLITQPAFSTPQIPDKIEYEGQLNEVYFKGSYLPSTVTKKLRFLLLNHDRCSANWAGYVVTWKIIQNHLYVLKITTNNCGKDPVEIPLNTLFPEQSSPVLATWFSGIVCIPDMGTNTMLISYGDAIYAKEQQLTMQSGQVIDQKIINNDFEKIKQEQHQYSIELSKQLK